jgi:hypothetical protein
LPHFAQKIVAAAYSQPWGNVESDNRTAHIRQYSLAKRLDTGRCIAWRSGGTIVAQNKDDV